MSLKSGVQSKLINPTHIRNFCIIAHVDHGKSTLADWLISSAKLISEIPGRRFLDSRPDEQERGITISSAAISYTVEGHIFNLIDSPGHADFGANVTTALRACDGALLLIDAVEGMMPQTVAVLKQAIAENVVPILFINKMDRLFVELHLTADEIKKRLQDLVTNINEFISSLNPHECIIPFSFKTGNIILGAGLEGWALNLAFSNYTLKHVLECYTSGTANNLKSMLPLANCVTSTLIKLAPSPVVAQTYKLSRIGTHINEEFKKPIVECNPLAKVVGIVVGISHSKERGKLVSLRLFAGSIKKGQILYSSVSNAPMSINRVCISLGKQLEEHSELPAGMLVTVIGLDEVRIGSTISEDPSFPSFESIKHVAEPVMTVSFTPKDQSKLARLKDLLIQECIQDITLKYEFNSDTKEHILKGLGKLHIEVVLNRIQAEEKIELLIKPPTVIYLETIRGVSGIHNTVSSNKLNKFSMSVFSLDEKSIQVLTKYENLLKVPGYVKLFPNDCVLARYAKHIVAIDRSNVLIDNTKSVQFMQETIPNVILGFRKAMAVGPLLKRNVINTAVLLEDATWHCDFVHRTPLDIAPPTAKLIHSAMNEIGIHMLEPYIKCYITVDLEYLSNISRQIKINNGKLLDTEYTTMSVTIVALIPVKNSFKLAEEFMRAAEGKVSWRYEPAEYDYMSTTDLNELVLSENTKTD